MAHKLTSLKNQVAIVTGAGGGLGRTYALLLAQHGAKVVVNDCGSSVSGKGSDVSVAQKVVDEIQVIGGIAVADTHDVGIPEQTKQIVQTAVDNFGTVHMLINNAGIGCWTPHDDVDVASYRRIWEVTCLGSTCLMSAVWPYMRQQHYGRIVNTCSDSIFGLGIGGDCSYPAAKAWVFATTRDLGKYSEKDGIKINAIHPSGLTRMSEASPSIKELTQKYLKLEQVAPFVLALASEECPVSGESFSANGGRAARCVLATFPGHAQEDSPEAWIANFDKVMGKNQEVYVPKDCMDLVSYTIKMAYGVDLGVLSPI